MKGLSIAFQVKEQKNSKNKNTKTDGPIEVTGEHLNFTAQQTTTKDSPKALIGEFINLTISEVGSWSWEDKKTQSCMICKLPLKQGATIARCPMCESTFHQDHLFDWLKMRGKCPVCRQSLRQESAEIITL